MTPEQPNPHDEQTGVDDVRRVREEIAAQYATLAEHAADTKRIVDKLRKRLRLGPVVPPPPRNQPRSGTEG